MPDKHWDGVPRRTVTESHLPINIRTLLEVAVGSKIRHGVATSRTNRGRPVVLTRNATVKSVEGDDVTTTKGVRLRLSDRVGSRSNVERPGDWHVIKEFADENGDGGDPSKRAPSGRHVIGKEDIHRAWATIPSKHRIEFGKDEITYHGPANRHAAIHRKGKPDLHVRHGGIHLDNFAGHMNDTCQVVKSVAQLNEVSNATLRDYIGKAASDPKREKGVRRALGKLTKRTRLKLDEHAYFTPYDNAPYNGPKIDLTKVENPNHYYDNHLNNYMILHNIQKRSNDAREKIHCSNQIGIAKDKMKFWERHPNFDQKKQQASIAAAKATSKAWKEETSLEEAMSPHVKRLLDLKQRLETERRMGNVAKIGSNDNAVNDFLRSGGNVTKVRAGARSKNLKLKPRDTSDIDNMFESKFGDAFAAARKSGSETFEFGGKKYTTRKAGESDDQWKGSLSPKPAPRPASRMPAPAATSDSGSKPSAPPAPAVRKAATDPDSRQKKFASGPDDRPSTASTATTQNKPTPAPQPAVRTAKGPDDRPRYGKGPDERPNSPTPAPKPAVTTTTQKRFASGPDERPRFAKGPDERPSTASRPATAASNQSSGGRNFSFKQKFQLRSRDVAGDVRRSPNLSNDNLTAAMPAAARSAALKQSMQGYVQQRRDAATPKPHPNLTGTPKGVTPASSVK